MQQPVVIDACMHGNPSITACFIVRGAKTALVETGPKTSLPCVLTALSEHGVDDLDYIVVTHVHLDHAGAAGALASHFPNATVAVHRVGAPHLVDPSKLWSSAARIYGDAMGVLWGGIDPVPEDRVLILDDGDEIDLGGRVLHAIDTPGHARHHHAYLDGASGTLLVGDALGVRLPDAGVVRPATPPPEFDLEVAIASIRRLADAGAESLWLTHFGPSDVGVGAVDDVDEICDRAIEALLQWQEWVAEAREEGEDLDAIAAGVAQRVRSMLERSCSEAQVDRLERTTSYRMNTWGYLRYMDRRAGR